MADESSDGQPTRNRTPAKRRRPARRSSGHRSWRTRDSRYRRFNRVLLLVGVLLIGAAGIITLIALILSTL